MQLTLGLLNILSLKKNDINWIKTTTTSNYNKNLNYFNGFIH